MTRTLREAIAHAATPWEWRTRTSVMGLVVVAVVVPVAFIAIAWIERDGMNRLVTLLFYGGLGSVLLVRPAVRSLRRWDQRHPYTAVRT